MSGSLKVSKRLPTSVQIEQYFRNQFKGTITLAVNREAGEGLTLFPVDSEGCVSLVVAIRKGKKDAFRNSWTGRLIKNGKNEDSKVYSKHRVNMQGQSGVACLLNIENWGKEFGSDVLPRRKKGEPAFAYLAHIASCVFDSIDDWLLRNVEVVLLNTPNADKYYNLKIHMIKGKQIPDFIHSFKIINSSISLISPSVDHPDASILEVALSFEKKTGFQAMMEASTAYSGYVDVSAYTINERTKYLKILRSTSSEFREYFDIV